MKERKRLECPGSQEAVLLRYGKNRYSGRPGNEDYLAQANVGNVASGKR